MTQKVTYKLQGNRTDSWLIQEFDDKEELVNAYMVYEKPDGWFSPNDIEAAKQIVFDKIDSRTQELIFKGFDFDGCHWSLSITAQINWSNIPNLPKMFFPLAMQDQGGVDYKLEYANRMNFYLTAVGAKNQYLQSGNKLCSEVDVLKTIEEVLNFIDNRE